VISTLPVRKLTGSRSPSVRLRVNWAVVLWRSLVLASRCPR